MKKYIGFGIVLGCVLIAVVYTTVFTDNKDLVWQAVLERNGVTEVVKTDYADLLDIDTDMVIDDVIYGYETANSSWETVNESWELIPEEWRQIFKDSGWNIIVSSSYICPYELADNVSGFTAYSDKTIWVQGNIAAKWLQITVIHEFGHFIDWYYGFPSQTSAYKKMYKKEVKTFDNYSDFSDHATGTPVEYFATIFMQSVLMPETMETAPRSYAVIQDLVNFKYAPAEREAA